MEQWLAVLRRSSLGSSTNGWGTGGACTISCDSDTGSQEATAWIATKGIEKLPVLIDKFVAQYVKNPFDANSPPED